MLRSTFVSLGRKFNAAATRSTSLNLFSKTGEILSFDQRELVKPYFPLLVSIEGNIGAGKTTLLSKLRKSHPEWIAIDEPVDTWSKIKNDNDESILEVFYKDRKRWSYTFQNCALLTRYQNIESAVKEAKERSIDGGVQVFLTERCLDTDYHVFTKMLKAEGSIDSLELELYERLLVQLKSTATPLSAIVHVNSSPSLCAQRIRMRGRNGEEAITMDYLNSLDSVQTKWVKSTIVPTISVGDDYEQVENFITEQAIKAGSAGNTGVGNERPVFSTTVSQSILH